MKSPRATVVGAGLAGTECAWQLAEQGLSVTLLEQKPCKRTPAHVCDGFAELVCSNSLRATALANAVGLLKEEMRRARSLVMAVADATRVRAGGALAVNRETFSAAITSQVRSHPRIEVICTEVTAIPEERPVVLATGPLTGDALAADLAACLGGQHLAYYDAIAPVVAADSIDWERVFRASRYGKGGDDAYVNCPMDEAQYSAFVAAVLDADKVVQHAFEDARYFEGCLPIEVMAERGARTLAFGPMKPVGLLDPRSGRRPHAVVQLRAEDDPPTAYNLVGFQTRMKWQEQARIFRMIPGLEQAAFLRMGSVHRNTFVDAPRVLDDFLMLRSVPGVHLAGQITGVEGYVESAASGLVVGLVLGARERGQTASMPPATTAFGALTGHLRNGGAPFQPSNIVWSMFPSLSDARLRKRVRFEALAERALRDLAPWLDTLSASCSASHVPCIAGAGRLEVPVGPER